MYGKNLLGLLAKIALLDLLKSTKGANASFGAGQSQIEHKAQFRGQRRRYNYRHGIRK